MTLAEQWRYIKGFEGRYEISSYGRIRSIERRVRSRYKTRVVTAKILKTLEGKSGYLVIVLRNNGKCIQKSVHRLVAEAFIPNIEDKKTVNHKDGNKENNTVENLEWATYSENIIHSYHSLPHKKARNMEGVFGALHPRAKPIVQSANGVVLAVYECITEASKYTGISRTGIANNLAGRSLSAGGYNWTYKM